MDSHPQLTFSQFTIFYVYILHFSITFSISNYVTHTYDCPSGGAIRSMTMVAHASQNTPTPLWLSVRWHRWSALYSVVPTLALLSPLAHSLALFLALDCELGCP